MREKETVVTDNAYPFVQLCVWPGCTLGGHSSESFVEFMGKEFGVRVKFECEVKTNPDVEDGQVVRGTGGRSDLFFYCHAEDLCKFAIPRLAAGIRWWEDVLSNGGGDLYSAEFLKSHPRQW